MQTLLQQAYLSIDVPGWNGKCSDSNSPAEGRAGCVLGRIMQRLAIMSYDKALLDTTLYPMDPPPRNVTVMSNSFVVSGGVGEADTFAVT